MPSALRSPSLKMFGPVSWRAGDRGERPRGRKHQQGNQGVHFLLNNVQICRTDGKRLDGRKSAPDDFEEYEDVGGVGEEVDDEIPF